MLGYWNNNRRPVTTTAQNWMENFNIFIPRLGFMFFVILFAVFSMVSSLIHPAYEYTYHDANTSLTIEYQKWIGSDEVVGRVIYAYDANGESYTCDSPFKGTINSNGMNITLNKPEVRDYTGPVSSLSTNMMIGVNTDGILFQDIKATGGRGLFSLPWDKSSYKFS